MNQRLSVIFIYVIFVLSTQADKLVIAHYMPWYASKEVSGYWGWHWTMNHFDPEKRLENGQRQVASQDYPLIGLYDSGDPQVLECQILQMKFAGIDGVIFDWYGTKDHNDYAFIHRNTLAMIKQVKRAGLKFAICYEDQAVGQIVKGGKLKPEEAPDHANSVMQWVDKEWFADPSYLSHQDRPVMLVFGPQYFKPDQWPGLFKNLKTKPWVYSLPHLTKKFDTDGTFGWPPVTGGEEITYDKWSGYLDRLYSNKSNRQPAIATAFPGFHDIYNEAKLQPSYGFIDDRNGRTLTETLDRALASDSPIIQIATWNDYGEGTIIEPTMDDGYKSLEAIQLRMIKDGSFTKSDLRLPALLLKLRKELRDKPAAQAPLNEAAELLFADKIGEAAASLSVIQARWQTK